MKNTEGLSFLPFLA